MDSFSKPDPTAALAPAGDSRFDVFLSHSSRDKPAVERIARGLKEAGLEPWFDAWQLTPGGDWQSEIVAGLRASRSCAVFVGGEELGDWERQELQLALDQAAKDRSFRIFATLLPGVAEPFDPTQLPPFLSTRTWVDFRRGFNDRGVFQRLVNAVLGIPVGADEAPTAHTGICPYRGLQTFDEEHAEFFFGRDADVQRLLERLKERRFLAVLGPSGSGKSSLVRAGLVPALRRGALVGSDTWRMMVLRPGAEPLTTVAAHLLDLAAEGSMQKTVDLLAEDPRTLHLAVARALASASEDARTVWVIDQFEEVFTLCSDEAQRRALFANLLHAAFAPGGKTFVVITMRADFYPKCAGYPELAQGVSANQFLAWPMEEWALAEAIEEPARAVGLQLEEGLTDQILSDLREAPGALPLMEHTLLELWERRRGSMLTLEAYREAGGVAGSLAKRADLIYEGLLEHERAIARRVLLRLTQPGEGTEDTRRRAAFEELVGAGEQREPVERVVGALAQARLLTTGTDPACDDRVVDVSHEALIRGWPRLREWLDEDRTGLRTHRRLTEAAQEWARAGRDPEALYRGARLAQASEWAERNAGEMNALESQFLRESVDAQESARRRRQRRARVAAGALVGGLVVVAALALVAFLQKGRADEQGRLARSREIAATAIEQLDRDPQLTLLLAIEAYETAPTAQAEAAVRRALVNSHLRRILPVESPGETSLELSPDGRVIATGTPLGEIALWDRASGRRLAVLQRGSKGEPGEGPGGGVSFSPDGKRLYASHGRADGRIWSVPDGRLIAELKGGGGFVGGGWTPDGRSVLSADRGVARLWDARTGAVRAQFPAKAPRGDPFTVAVLSPDGRYVALQDADDAVRLVRVATGRTVGALRGRLIPGRRFSPDGRRLLLGETGERKGLRIYDVPSGRLVRVIPLRLLVYDPAFSPDGRRIIGGGEGDAARIWDVSSGRLLLELAGHGSDILGVGFSRDGKLAVTAGEDSTVRLWDADGGRLVAVFSGHPGPVDLAKFTPDGRFVVTASRDVRVWEVPSGASTVFRGHEGPVVSVRFSPDGRSVVSAEVGMGTVRIWDVAKRRLASVLQPEFLGRDLHTWAEFSRDGRLVVTSGIRDFSPVQPGPPTEQEPVRLWDLASGSVRLELPAPRATPTNPPKPEAGGCFGPCAPLDAALSPDGRRLAVISEDGSLSTFDAANGRALETAKLPQFGSGVAWTPNGSKIIAFSGDRIHVVDATTLRTLREFGPKEGGGVFLSESPAIRRDGALVAVGYQDRTARVWETETGRLVAELPNAGPVEHVAFSPNGRFLVAAAASAATIWDLESQRPLVQLFGHQGGVIEVDFSPDGSSIVTSGVDRTVRIWRCEVCAPIDDVLRLARARVLRDLTEAERERFL